MFLLINKIYDVPNIVLESEATLISEMKLVNNITNWVVDIGASRHICFSKELLFNYEEVIDEENVYLGDSGTARVAEMGKVLLKFTSGKFLALHFVLHDPNMCRNLVSGFLLNKASLKIVFESNKIILSQNSDFVGLPIGAQNSLAYRCLVLETNTIVETRDADFFEHIFHMNRMRLTNESSSVIPQMRSSSNLDENHSTQELRRSKRPKNGTNFGPDFITTFLIEDEPKTYQEAMKSVDATFWKDAIHSELESIMANHTWELVEFPRGCKTIGCKWVFKKKLKADRSIDKFKARLVAKGYTQKEGVDYFDTYSPVTRLTTIRILIAMASIHKLIVHQMDVKTKMVI